MFISGKIKKKKRIDKFSKKKFIAVIDYGIKNNILDLLSKSGFDVIVFPNKFSIKKILNLNPLGFFLSNGPGDPKATFKNTKENLEVLKKLKYQFLEFVLDIKYYHYFLEHQP